MSLNLSTAALSSIVQTAQTPTSVAAGFILSSGDGKGVPVTAGHRMVKISEKKIGKGKGKTVSFCIIPVITGQEYQENFTAVIPMLNELCEELQRDIATRMQRDGIKAITPSDISIPACVVEWTNRTFSSETVGAWFDSEVSELLALQILTIKGWNAEALNAEQVKYLETKAAAYRASYIETTSKFPSLNPSQCAELSRVIELLELSGPIVSRIRDKIGPKETKSSLGF